MKVYLSNSAFIRNIDSLLRNFDATDPTKLEIITHDKWISVHPVVLAMVAALGLKVGPDNVICDDVVARSGHYLERMGLFHMLGMPPKFTISEHDPSGRFVPLTQIKTSDELKALLADIVPMLHLPPEQARSIHYVVSELVRNVLEHAEANDGAILAAQYHPTKKMIRIGIVDTGVGIRASISQSHNAPDDLSAIKLALTPGITGTTFRETGTDYNAGAGLFFIKSIASASRNYFMLYSGSAMYKLFQRRPTVRAPILRVSPDRDLHSELVDLPFFQGTVVGVDISLEETREFAMLLELIRTTYVKAIRERQKARYKRARFI